MDWNLPDMSDEEYEKLVDQFDAFLRGWEKKYFKNHPEKRNKQRDRFNRPDVNDVSEYMTLEEIKEYLLSDFDLTDEERFELYYQEHLRVKQEKENKKSKPLEKIMKNLDITFSDGSQDSPPKKK